MSARSLSGARWQRTVSLPVVGALLVGIVSVELIASAPLTLWGVLYAVPVLLAAQRLGRRGGLAAAGLAIALMVGSAQIEGLDLDVLEHLPRAATLLAVGLLAPGVHGRGGGLGADASSPVLPAASPAEGSPPSDREVRRGTGLAMTGVATWELDLATGHMQWSDAYRQLYGADPEAPLTSREAFQQIVVPEDRDLLSAAIEKIAADGTTIEIRYRIIRPDDGAERIIRSHIRAQEHLGDGHRLVGTAQDVTELVRILTPRESEMLMLLADGLSGDEIAERLVLSPATVRTHIQNAMTKLGSHTRGQAIAAALRSNEIGS